MKEEEKNAMEILSYLGLSFWVWLRVALKMETMVMHKRHFNRLYVQSTCKNQKIIQVFQPTAFLISQERTKLAFSTEKTNGNNNNIIHYNRTKQ